MILTNSDPTLLVEAKYVEDFNPNLLSWVELSNLINIRPLMTTSRVKLLDGQGRKFNWIATGWHRDPNCYPPSLIRSLLDEMVIYFTDMSRATERINDFARAVEDEYQRQVDAHIYVCRDPKLEHPFGAHIDEAHNIIIQCEGETNFKVWNELKDGEKIMKDGDNINMKIDDKPMLDVIMKPGDAIWVPMYCPHHAVSLSPRMSVSFPFTPRGLLTKANEDRNWISL